MNNTLRLSAALSAAVLLLSACGGASSDVAATSPAPAGASEAPAQGGSGADDQPGKAAKVEIVSIAFKPGDLKVLTGTEVTWENLDKDVAHTVTSGKGGSNAVPGVDEGEKSKPDGIFDGDLPAAGDTFSFTFEEAGTFDYFCEIHPSMKATITVE